jgi:hypothetical protein
MFVLSMSWQNDRISICNSGRTKLFSYQARSVSIERCGTLTFISQSLYRMATVAFGIPKQPHSAV